MGSKPISERSREDSPAERRPRARKRYGQHFLERAWADKLVEAIAPQLGERFIEIGPGPGALTLRLAPRVAHLTAIEIDRDMSAALAPRLPPNVTLATADFLDVDVATLTREGPVRVAGNLPFNVASPILFKLLRAHREGAGLIDATLMLQREVADRIEARPSTKEYGVLAVLVQVHADVRRVLSLPPGAFRPAPKVHSAVLRFTFRAPRVAADDRTFESLVRALFTQRRKTLLNALRPFATGRGVDPAEALAAAQIDPSRRPETLDLLQLARLADAVAAQGQGPPEGDRGDEGRGGASERRERAPGAERGGGPPRATGEGGPGDEGRWRRE